MGIVSAIANETLKDTLEGLDDITNNLQGVTESYISLEKIIPGVIDLFVNQSKEVRNLNKELGQGSKSVASFKANIAALSGQIGVGTRETIELLNTTKKYHQGLNDTTAATLKFIKASGASSDIVGTLTSKMKIMGVVSEESLTTTYENLLAVRDAYGLTNDEIDNIIDSITKYAITTQASSDQIDRATTVLAKFTSQLTSAGMEADKVKDIIDGMLDPDRITDNIVLMNKLGVSMTDMVSGDPIAKLEGSTEKLKELGQEISEIAKTNRLQANEVAKVYGLTLEQANMLANLDTSEGALNTQKKLDQYRNEMANFSESITAFKDKMIGVISGPLAIFGKVLENLSNALGIFGRGVAGIVSVFFINKILKLIKRGLDNIVGQAAKKFSKEMGQYLGGAQSRLTNKAADMAGLAPVMKNGKPDYGRIRNYRLRAEAERDRFNIASGRAGRNKSNLSAGEMIEYAQAERSRINELKKYGASLDKNSKEYHIFDQTYGTQIDAFEKRFVNLINTINERANWKEYENTYVNSFKEDTWSKQNDDAKKTIIEQFNQVMKIRKVDTKDFGLLENKDKVAEIAGMSSGPKEFMEKLIEFYKASDDPNAAKYIGNITSELKKYNDTTIDTAGGVKELNEATKQYNKVLNESKKGLLGNIGNLFKGLGTNIGTFFMKHFNPMKLLKMSGLGLLAGGVISKITSSLKENEKTKETTEKISKTFDEFMENIQPAIEGLSSFISNIYKIIEGPLNKVLNWTAKVANSIGTGLGKVTNNISDSVATIEDSYKEKDLREMMLVKGTYDSATDKIEGAIGDLAYEIRQVVKLNKESVDLQYMAVSSSGSK